jgi:peptide/nickel transport system permease protein
MIIATALGTLLGLVAGLSRGVVDNFIMFLVDARMAIPFTLLALVAAAIFGSGPLIMILIIGLSGWAGFTRLTRGQVLQIRDQQFIESSQAIGASQIRRVFEHILPNIASPLIVQATLRLSSFILLESSLSYLGLGVQPPEISLGLLVSTGRDYLINAWTLSVFPSLAIILIVLQVSLIGDWLRDALDPKLRRDI